VPAIEPEALAQALVARNNTPPAQAGITARIAEGNYREALHLLQHSDQDFYQLLRDWLNATLKNQPLAYAKPIEEISRMGRENQKQFLRYFTHLLEGAVRLRALAAAGREEEVLSLFSESEREFVPRLNRVCTLEQLEAIGDELDKAAYYIERNAHSKILFHALTIKIFQIVKNNRVLTA
ncbi:MAG TPA: hypothetical protein VHK69_15050, partial [Chitinophagaceae bacterium]|nr:hypothetical protein [Chitinophagaceae bacterium]